MKLLFSSRTSTVCHCEDPPTGGDEAISHECKLEQAATSLVECVERLPRPFGARNDNLDYYSLLKFYSKRNFCPVIFSVFIFIFSALFFAPSAAAWSSLYGQVYYTRPDGTKIGLNGVGIANWTVGKTIHVTEYSNGTLNFGGGSFKSVSPGDGYYVIRQTPYVNEENNPYCPNAAPEFCFDATGPLTCAKWSCGDAIGCGCEKTTGSADCRSVHVIAPPDITHRTVPNRPTPPTSFPPGVPTEGDFYPVAPGVARTANMASLDQVACGGTVSGEPCGGYNNGSRYHLDFEYVPRVTPTPSPTKVPCGGPCNNSNECDIECPICDADHKCVPEPTKVPCGGPCNNSNECDLSCPICTSDQGCVAPSPTPTKVPCGGPCTSSNECDLDCPICDEDQKCKKGCDSPCTAPDECPLDCPLCVAKVEGGPSTCSAPVGCDEPCTSADQCIIDCPICFPGPNGGVCKKACDTPCTSPDECPLDCPICASSGKGRPVKCIGPSPTPFWTHGTNLDKSATPTPKSNLSTSSTKNQYLLPFDLIPFIGVKLGFWPTPTPAL